MPEIKSVNFYSHMSVSLLNSEDFLFSVFQHANNIQYSNQLHLQLLVICIKIMICWLN